MMDFEQYVERMIVFNKKDPEQICMFSNCNTECYVDKRDPEHGCLNCPAAKISYEKYRLESWKKFRETELTIEYSQEYLQESKKRHEKYQKSFDIFMTYLKYINTETIHKKGVTHEQSL